MQTLSATATSRGAARCIGQWAIVPAASFKSGAALAMPGLHSTPPCRRSLRVTAFRENGEERTTTKGKPGVEAAKDVPAFTRRREHAVGRVASLGMAADIVGEVLTGVGPIHQLSLETGFSPRILFAALALLLATNFVGGLSPYSETFSERNQRDVNRRAPDGSVNPNPRKFFAEAEINIGRAAMVGILSAVVLEFLGGGAAPLARLGFIPPGGGSLANAGFGLTALVALFTANGFGAFSIFGDFEGRDEDVY